MKASEQIETEIERTRGVMSDTIHAIERKLSPNRLVDEAMQTMRNINISNSTVLDLLRDNPLPLALAGLGLGWLALAAITGRDSQTAQGGRLTVAEAPGSWVGSAAGGNGSGSETAAELEGLASAAVNEAGQRIGRWTETVRNRAGEMAARGSDVFQDHPVTVGLLAMAAGLALGMAMPRRRQALAERAATDSGDQVLRKTGRILRQAAAAVGEGAAQTMQKASEALRGEAGVAH